MRFFLVLIGKKDFPLSLFVQKFHAALMAPDLLPS